MSPEPFRYVTAERIADKHLADLHRSGLSDANIANAKIKSVPPHKLENYVGAWAEVPGLSALLFMYPHIDGDFFRAKLFPAQQDGDGHAIKYVQPKGSEPRLYFGDKAWAERLDTTKLLVVTEGEKKTIKAEAAGYACIGIGGIWSWLHEGKPIKDFKLIAFSERPVLIVYDSDIWLDPEKKKALFALGMELRSRNAQASGLVAVELPAINGQKTGLDDYLVERERREQQQGARRIVTDEPLPPLLPNLELAPDNGGLVRHAFWNNRAPMWATERVWFYEWRKKKPATKKDEPPPLTKDEVAEVKQRAKPILDSHDPLGLVGEELRRQGFGGDLKTPLLIYLGMTTRLLLKRHGSLPVHMQVNGPAGTGKTYTIECVLSLLPPDCCVRYDASSAHVLIYEPASFKHRVLFFGEADSIPGVARGSEEGSPVASFVRTVLSRGEATYKVLVKNKDTNSQEVREITQEGPTAFVTSTVHRLSATQLDSRMLAIDIGDDPIQARAALAAQAEIEEHGTIPEPNPALVAFQAYLQSLAPLRVVVPFARAFLFLLGESRTDSRLLRDGARLLSLIKAHAILNLTHREKDGAGRIVARLEDYEAVADLIADQYEGTSTGASPKVRELVDAVTKAPLRSVTGLANYLKVSQQAVSKRLKAAIEQGWLVNTETRPGYRASIQVGDPLPHPCGLPSVEQVRAKHARTPIPKA